MQDYLVKIADNIPGRTICAFGEACSWPVQSFVAKLGDAAAMPTIGFIKKFRSEFEEYLEGKRVEHPLIQIQPYGEPALAGAAH